ncbi:MAG: hypothetical protein ACP5R5_13250 [Armatimonadota bacterium]
MISICRTAGTAAGLGRIVALAGLLHCCVSPCLCAPCALIQIPTADVIEPGHVYLDIATALPAESGEYIGNSTFESCVGLRAGIELGYDGPPCTFHDGAFFVKKRLGAHRNISAALGINGIGFRGNKWNPYLVCSTDTSPLRAHLGTDYFDEKWRPMLGVEYAATDCLTLMADWMSGDERAYSYGFNLTFGRNQTWGLMVGLIHENGGGNESVYINLGREFAF